MALISKQLKLDFEKLTESALKPLAKKFDKWQCNVVKIDATNKGRRESGFMIKEFTFHFEDGQQMLVRVKGDGTIFQVKLNKKVVPVRHVDDMDRAIVEMVDYVQQNAKAYERAKIQRLKNKKLRIEKPPVRTSRAEKIESYKGKLSEVQGINTDLEKQLSEVNVPMDGKRDELKTLKSQLEAELKRTDELTAEIETLKKQQEAA